MGRGPRDSLHRNSGGKTPRLAFVLMVVMATGVGAQTRVLDDFATVAGWTALPADGVRLAIVVDRGFLGSAMRLDYDFQGHAGWASARKAFSLDLRGNWQFSFRLRGTPRTQTLEFKLLDPSGENVWWSVRRDLAITGEWQRIVVAKRQVTFAWGPAGGGEIDHLGAIEIAVTASDGGAGSVWIDDLAITALPPPGPYLATPCLTASSKAPGHGPELALDGDAATAWRSAADAEGPQRFEIDFGERREVGGLVIDWDGERVPRGFEAQTSDDGASWTTAWRVDATQGGRSYVALPENDGRWIRLVLESPPVAGAGIREIAVQPPEFASTPTEFLRNIAAEARRGLYPRGMLGEMTSWALVGSSPGGAWRGLLSADGAFEPAARSSSLEPFVLLDGALVTWADVTTSQSLLDGHLPIPTVTWTHRDFTLEVTALVTGDGTDGESLVRYRLANRSADRIAPELFVAARPFQVNPPSQFLNTPGGAASPETMRCQAGWIALETSRLAVLASPAPAGCGAAELDRGDIVVDLVGGRLPATRAAAGTGSAALRWDLDLAPGAAREIVVAVPHTTGWTAARIDARARDFAREAPERATVQQASAAAAWRERLSRVEITVPSAGRELLDTLRANQAYMLVNRDGAAFEPGARSYRRSWIRDGAMMSAALLRLGHGEDVKAYARWYAGHQYDDGKVPCCVDRRGADPVPENDADGEFIFLVAETTRLTGDRGFAEELWPRVERAAAHLDALRAKRRTEAYRAPDKLVFFGLLPESISHEGYSAKPMHSYWDDFWAMRGLADAAELAGLLGRSEAAVSLARSRDELRADVAASVALAMRQHGIDYVPGCAELGDFDATSTTVALAPTGADAFLPRVAVKRTFERAWGNFVARRDGAAPWENYTPYELRIVGSFVRLGWRERASDLLDFYLRDRMPKAWRQWPEIVWKDTTTARFLGDLPHTWVGSDFVRSFLDMLAWERERDGALVLAAGVPASWLAEGVSVHGLATRWGPLGYALRSRDGTFRVTIDGGLRVPPGGIVLQLPLAAPPRIVRVNGLPVVVEGEEIVVRAIPAEVEVVP